MEPEAVAFLRDASLAASWGLRCRRILCCGGAYCADLFLARAPFQGSLEHRQNP